MNDTTPQASAPTPPTQPTAPVQPPAPTPQPPKDHTDVMGIISIVMIFVFLHLPGFILGLVGASKAKREGYSPVLSRVGWIANLISMILTLLVVTLFILLVIFAKQQADEIKASGTSSIGGDLSAMTSREDFRTDSGDGFSIAVPDYFTDLEAEYRNDAASYSKGFDFTNEYVMVIKESTVDFSSSMTVQGYADLLNKNYQDGSSLTSAVVTPLTGVSNPNGLQTVDYKVTGDTDNVKIVYYVRYVKTATSFYQVVAWTSPSTVVTAEPTLIAILESFRSE